jgi:hypothetical protein
MLKSFPGKAKISSVTIDLCCYSVSAVQRPQFTLQMTRCVSTAGCASNENSGHLCNCLTLDPSREIGDGARQTFT